MPIIIIRATQRLMISRAVESTWPGRRSRRSRRRPRASRASRTARAPTRTRCRARRGRAPAGGCRTRAALGRSPARSRGSFVAVPDGQLVAPPELARDAPRADLLHPAEEDALGALRVEARRGPRAPPRSPARPARPCGRTTAARRAARRASPERWQCADGVQVRLRSRAHQPALAQVGDHALAPPRRPSARRSARRRPRSCARRSRSPGSRRARAARPISKSFGSCAGRDLERARAERRGRRSRRR